MTLEDSLKQIIKYAKEAEKLRVAYLNATTEKRAETLLEKLHEKVGNIEIMAHANLVQIALHK